MVFLAAYSKVFAIQAVSDIEYVTLIDASFDGRCCRGSCSIKLIL